MGPLGRHTGLTVADGASGTASSSSARSPWNVLGLNWKEKGGERGGDPGACRTGLGVPTSTSTNLGVRHNAPDGHCPLARVLLAQLVVAHHHRPRQLVLGPIQGRGQKFGGGGTSVPPCAPFCRDPTSPCPRVPGEAVGSSEHPGAPHQHPSAHQLPVQPHRHQPGPGPRGGHAAPHDPSLGGRGVEGGARAVPAAPWRTKLG